MLAYYTVAAVLMLPCHLYFAARIAATRATPRWRWLGATSLGISLGVPLLLIATLSAAPAWAWLTVPLGHVAFAYVGFCIFLLAGMAARDALWFPARLVRATPTDPERRKALLRGLNLAVGSVAAGATAVGYGIALADPVVSRTRIRCRNAPPGWPGLRVVQVSDLHVGPTIRGEFVQRLVASVNALAPDVVVITGDVVDGYVSQLADIIAPIAGLRARHGVYFVTGNHEYYYRAEDWLAHFRACGIRPLQNQHELIRHEGARVLLAGLDDPDAPRATAGAASSALDLALADAPACDVRVLLCHRPGDAHRAARAGFDLQLSGHLHGGQFFPVTWLVHVLEPYVAGLYRVGNMWLYVNRGAGYWGPPNRLGVRQEVSLLEFTAV